MIETSFFILCYSCIVTFSTIILYFALRNSPFYRSLTCSHISYFLFLFSYQYIYQQYSQYIEHGQEIKYVTLNINGVTKWFLTHRSLKQCQKGISEYNLIYKQGISANTIHPNKKRTSLHNWNIRYLVLHLGLWGIWYNRAW